MTPTLPTGLAPVAGLPPAAHAVLHRELLHIITLFFALDSPDPTRTLGHRYSLPRGHDHLPSS